MSNETSRGQKRRRDADDYDPEAKIMRKLFVKNIPTEMTEATLREHFEQFGPVETCDIAVGNNGVSKGFAFLVYERAGGVDACQLARPHQAVLQHHRPWSLIALHCSSRL